MKKRQHEFTDEILRRRLENTDSPVPEDMWSRIQAARKDKRIHPLGWYYFSASILLVATISLWLSFGSAPADQPTFNQQDLPVLQEEQTADQNASSNRTADLSEVSDQATQTTQSIQNEDYTTNTNIQKSSDSKSVSTANKSAIQVTTANSNLKSRASASGRSSNTQSGSASGSSKDLRGQDSPLKDIASSNGNQIASSDKQVITTNRRNTAVEMSDLEKSIGQNAEVVELDYRFATTDRLFREQVGGVQSEQTQTLPGIGKAAKYKSSPSCYSFNSFLRGLSVDAYFAPEYASRQLVYKDPSMIEYAEQRKNDESYTFAYSAGFRVNAHFKGGLALRTGLIYTDIAEKLKYRDENAEVIKVINVTLDTIYQNGNIVYVWDTLSVTEYGSYNKIGYNRYRFYDIPLMVGYEIDRGNWVIQLNTGILFNIAASQRGDFLNPDHQLVNFDSNNEQGYEAFRTRVGSSLLMSMGFNYSLRPKLHLLFEPQLRVWMRPLNIQSYPIDQKYVNLGVAMGIRQYF